MSTPVQDADTRAATFTDIDLNTDATTTVYDPESQSTLAGVYLQNGGSTAVVQLEVTDGTDTAVLTLGQAAGDGIAFSDELHLAASESVQVNVTTVEGAAQTNTAVASHRAKD